MQVGSGSGSVHGIEALENIFVHFGAPVMLAITAGGGDGSCLDVIQVLEDFSRRKKHDFIAKIDHPILQRIAGHSIVDLEMQALLFHEPAVPQRAKALQVGFFVRFRVFGSQPQR
ncbi:hypothetical protein D3C84_951040 [compost metagenome]